jgi:hypothetical protein
MVWNRVASGRAPLTVQDAVDAPQQWAGNHTLEFPERGPPKKGNCPPVV